jgi:hypothetical protein
VVGAHTRDHLRDVCVDVVAAERAGDRHAVMAVAHEVDLADLQSIAARRR